MSTTKSSSETTWSWTAGTSTTNNITDTEKTSTTACATTEHVGLADSNSTAKYYQQPSFSQEEIPIVALCCQLGKTRRTKLMPALQRPWDATAAVEPFVTHVAMHARFRCGCTDGRSLLGTHKTQNKKQARDSSAKMS